MKGIIFNAVEEAVIELFDADTWDNLVEAAGVSGSYKALGTYPDSELLALVHVATEVTGMSTEEVLHTLGRKALPVLVDEVEELVDRKSHVFDFLGTIHDIIHVEVRKLAPDAQTPDIITKPIDDNSIEVTYRSKRNMPALAEGLILGAGDMFEQELSVETQKSDEESTVFVVSLVNETAEAKEPSLQS